MKTEIILITLSLTIGIFTACTDKKKTEEKVEVEIISEVKETAVEEIPLEETMDTAEKIRQDSLRQVKEHGHAH